MNGQMVDNSHPTNNSAGAYSVAMGYDTTASGEASTAMGYSTTASGAFSTAMGDGTTASDYGSTVIGQFNSSGSTVTNSATTYDADNTAFVIGNGTASNAKSDAFKVMFNGDATVSNDLTVSGDVVVSSDARLKSNIVSLGSTLSRLLLIDGKTYTMIKDGKQKIGVLAQDIREVFPELVTEDANEMLAVNYQGLVPVLINALKEQDAKMNEQQTEIDELKEMVQALVSRE
jgi:autotransporter adhesin